MILLSLQQVRRSNMIVQSVILQVYLQDQFSVVMFMLKHTQRLL